MEILIYGPFYKEQTNNYETCTYTKHFVENALFYIWVCISVSCNVEKFNPKGVGLMVGRVLIFNNIHLRKYKLLKLLVRHLMTAKSLWDHPNGHLA